MNSWRSAARMLHQQQAPSNVASTSEPVPVQTARTGIHEKDSSKQQPVVHTRSEFAAMMQSASVKIQEGATTGSEGEAAFAEMEQAMASLMALSYKEAEPRKLHRVLATRWAQDDADPLMEDVMDDPVTLASGYSVDQSHMCPATGKSYLPPSTTADTLLIPLVTPSEEQIQVILEKLSGSSGPPKETLHLIQLVSKTSKGVQPCLEKWPDLTAVLLDLKKKWKLSWTPDLEEERITIILNLSKHRPNREILAGQTKLPGVLKEVIEKADSLGSSASLLAMVASIISLLSEFDMFRKKMLRRRGMKMLRDLLKIEDAVVRKESGTAILALCKDEEGKASAEDYDVSGTLLECFTVTDEFLLLLDRLPKSPHVLDKICDQAVEWVNIVMGGQASVMITSRGIHSAISLIHTIALRDVGMLVVKNVEGFKECLRKLSATTIPRGTLYQIEELNSMLLRSFHFRNTMEYTLKWRLNDREWNDVREIRKLRPLRQTEIDAAVMQFQEPCRRQLQEKWRPNALFNVVLNSRQAEGENNSCCPPFLICPLSNKIMIDPVTIATGKTFERESTREWFLLHGHVCPLSQVPVSRTVLRNERVREYSEIFLRVRCSEFRDRCR